MRRLLRLALFASMLTPAAAFAQGAATPPSQGPLVLERVKSGFVVAPDYKVTDLDGDIAHLAGGYAGWLTEDTLFVGGGGYTVANRSDAFELTYGGLLVGWTMRPEHRIQFGARGLVGIGRATLGTDIDVLQSVDRVDRLRSNVGFGSRGDAIRGSLGDNPRVPGTRRVRVADDFFVFEPQLTLVTRISDHLAVNWGAGYRVTGYADRLGDRVNGATGSVAIQLGGW